MHSVLSIWVDSIHVEMLAIQVRLVEVVDMNHVGSPKRSKISQRSNVAGITDLKIFSRQTCCVRRYHFSELVFLRRPGELGTSLRFRLSLRAIASGRKKHLKSKLERLEDLSAGLDRKTSLLRAQMLS